MIYQRFVEIGRVVYVAKGNDSGKLAVIVDVVDGRRALVDGPSSGVRRSVRNFNDLYLTKFKVAIQHGMRTINVKKAFDEAEIASKFAESVWAKKIANKALKANMTDFDRYKLMRAKQARNRLIRVAMGKIRKTQKAQK
uniref:Large ribosomal subunit protein eL14 n=1 Tax=Steinernema glaseri TaxID=37863 RepID=A0A1I7ZVF0_9BILA